MATATKAQLEQQISDLQAELAAAQLRSDELQQQIEAAQPETPERRDQLEQVVWLQRSEPSDKQRRYDREGNLILNFGVQYAALDRRSGKRLFGPMRFYTAYGDLAVDILEVFRGDTRLARIGAYERPIEPAEDGTRRSEWVIASFSAIPSTRPAQPAPVAAGYGEPTGEEVPF